MYGYAEKEQQTVCYYYDSLQNSLIGLSLFLFIVDVDQIVMHIRTIETDDDYIHTVAKVT